ncbi:MAG TPA: DNA repair protein RecO [Oculatellaceae cyanobacterium]
MATYGLHAVNLGTFNLGETDKIVTMFSAERGIVRAVAKGARKPGAKIAGRSEPLYVNKLLLAKGRNLDIITQVEGIASFSSLRNELEKLSYGLYYAELTLHFGQDLSEASADYFDHLCRSLSLLAESGDDPLLLTLRFEMQLLERLGIKPELDVCVGCRDPLTEYRLSFFHHDSGGIICDRCFSGRDRVTVQEKLIFDYGEDAPQNPALRDRARSPYAGAAGTHVTPMVWKRLVLSSKVDSEAGGSFGQASTTPSVVAANAAARRLVQGYLEYKAGRRMRALDLLGDG